jgi:hypothetical protein
MKYALLVYDAPDAWKSLATEQEHAAHGEYHAVGASQGVIAHYRLRSSRRTTNVRLRAIYLIESDDPDFVLELAARIPAARNGGAVEIWPLTER